MPSVSPRPCAPTVVLLAALVWSASAFAQVQATVAVPEAPHPVRVHYQADAGASGGRCLSHRRVQEQTRRALGRKVFVKVEESDVVVVVREPGQAAADLQLLDREGRSLGARRLEAKDCTELDDLVAFALTVMVDFRSDEVGRKREEAARAEREALGARGETEPRDAASAGASTAATKAIPPEPVRPASSQPADGRRDGTTVASNGASPIGELGVGGVFETGLTPRPLIGLYGQLLAGSAPFMWGASVRGQHLFETPRSVGRLSAWRVAATARGCWLSSLAEGARLGVCLGLTPGVTWVSAAGFEVERTTGFVGVGLEPTFDLTFGLGTGMSASLGLGGVVPLLRNDWHAVTAEGERVRLFRAEAVGIVASLGVSWGAAKSSGVQ